MAHLLQPYASREARAEEQDDEPQRVAVERGVCLHARCDVYAEEEDGDAAPENLDMPHGIVYGRDILHDDTPHERRDDKPAVGWQAAYERHVGRGEDVEHHRGGDVPEGQLVVQPEVPVHQDIAYEVRPFCRAVAVVCHEARDVEGGGYEQPRRIDTPEAAPVEREPPPQEGLRAGRLARPRIPQPYAGEEEEDIDADVAHAAYAVEGILTRHADMEENDAYHRYAHDGRTVPADV